MITCGGGAGQQFRNACAPAKRCTQAPSPLGRAEPTGTAQADRFWPPNVGLIRIPPDDPSTLRHLSTVDVRPAAEEFRLKLA